MSAPNGSTFPVGMKFVRVYALTSDGIPAASSTTVYEGLQIVGAKAYDLTIPDARRIAHTGDDRVLAQDILPRQEVSSGTLRTATNPHDVYAVMTSTTQATIGESSVIGYGTDKQGLEPSLGLLMYQQAKEYGTGLRVYRSYIMPSTQAIINPTGMSSDAPEFQFSLLPTAVDHHLWGVAFDANTEGYTEAEIVEAVTFNIPHVVSWKGDGTVTEFVFNSARQAVSTAKIHAMATVSATGGTVTDVTSTYTKGVGTITSSGTLEDGGYLVCFYEYAAS
jgi:hypothetical protein